MSSVFSIAKLISSLPSFLFMFRLSAKAASCRQFMLSRLPRDQRNIGLRHVSACAKPPIARGDETLSASSPDSSARSVRWRTVRKVRAILGR
jgi:hypothetical protein